MRPSTRRGFIIAVAATLAANFLPPTPASAVAAPLTGKLVWMHNDMAQGDSDIWVMNADGSDQHALTTNAINESNPVWSPDGSKIAFTSTRDGASDIYVMDEDGTGVQRLAQGDFQLGDWSPTANELVGTLLDETGQFLVLIDIDTGGVTSLGSYDGYSPGAFSPDGIQILVTLPRPEDPEGGADLWMIDHSGARTRVTDTPSPMDEMGATWSPDGSRIAFFNAGEVFVMDADGTDVMQLTDDPGNETPTWSPDSASIAFNTNRADEFGDKWVMNADGSEQRPLVTMFGGEGSADWATGIIAPLPAPETVTGTIPAEGGTVTTADGTAPDVANPTDTTVTSPFGGDVTITESDQATQAAPGEYIFIGQQVAIDALIDPATSAENPLQVRFVLDQSLIPQRVEDGAEVLAFRNGALVEPCMAGVGDPAATPDPCAFDAFYSEDRSELTIDVLTSSASDWNFGLAPPFVPPPPDPPESVSGEVLPGGMLTTDTESDGVTAEDPLETTVTTSPGGVAGTVTISEIIESAGVAGPDFTFLDVFPSIGAPAGTAESPLLVEFLIHSSRFPNIPLEELRVLRHGVPIELCNPGPGDAAIPEPCVATQEFVGAGDVRIVVRTALVTDLIWTFGYNLRPQPLLLIASSALDSLDHVVLMLSDEIDPTSIPDPSDFDIRVGGVPVTETGVRLLYQGFRGFPILDDSGFTDGVALLKVSWEEADTLSSAITMSYTPGMRPLQDRSGNQTPEIQDLLLERLDPGFDLAFIDDGAGANHLVLLTAPLDPALPDAADFTVTLDDSQVLTGTDINLRHDDLGFGLLDITLDGSPQYSQQATLTYQPGAVPLMRADGSTVAGFTADVFVNVSGGIPGYTPPSEDGEPVTVTLNDYLGNGAATLEVTFPTVGEEGGVTTFQSLDAADVPPLGANFGDGAAFYDISTTAVFTPPAVICLTYDESAYEAEEDILLLHFEDPNWVELDTTLDTDANRACAPVDSFSPFAVAEKATTFDFEGFFKPIDNDGVLNVASAGRAIPVKFSLGGDQGMSIFAAGSPGSIRVACPSAALDTIETTTTATANSLSYDAASDRYTFVWKTEKSWSGTCRELRVTFTDGTTETALFKFGK